MMKLVQFEALVTENQHIQSSGQPVLDIADEPRPCSDSFSTLMGAKAPSTEREWVQRLLCSGSFAFFFKRQNIFTFLLQNKYIKQVMIKNYNDDGNFIRFPF